MAIAHTYRIGFVWMRSANVLSRPSINTVCYGKSHVLCNPMGCDWHGLPNIVVELPESVPSQQLLSLA